MELLPGGFVFVDPLQRPLSPNLMLHLVAAPLLVKVWEV